MSRVFLAVTLILLTGCGENGENWQEHWNFDAGTFYYDKYSFRKSGDTAMVNAKVTWLPDRGVNVHRAADNQPLHTYTQSTFVFYCSERSYETTYKTEYFNNGTSRPQTGSKKQFVPPGAPVDKLYELACK